MKKSICLLFVFAIITSTLSLGIFAAGDVVDNDYSIGVSDDLITIVDSIDLSKSELSILSDLLALSIVTDPAFKNTNTNALSVGAELPTYIYENGDLVKSNIARYFPIYEDQSVVALFSIQDPSSNSPTYAFAKEWAEELNEFGQEPYCIVLHDTKVFVKTQNQTELIKDYPMVSHSKSGRSSDMLEEDISCDDINSINGEIVYNNSELASDLNDIDISFYEDDMADSKTLSRANPPNSRITVTTNGVYFDEFPMWDREQDYGYCWAICMYLIDDWYNWGSYGEVYDPAGVEAICNHMGVGFNSGANMSAIVSNFDSYFGIPVSWVNTITNERIRTELSKGRPIFMYFSSAKYGHSVVANTFVQRPSGYKNILQVSDSLNPNGSYKALHVVSPNNNYTYSYSAQNMKWEQTIIPQVG